MTFKRLQELTRLANLEYKKDEIMKLRLEQLVLAVEDGADTIARLEAELKCCRIANGSLTNQLHKCVMADKGVYLEQVR